MLTGGARAEEAEPCPAFDGRTVLAEASPERIAEAGYGIRPSGRKPPRDAGRAGAAAGQIGAFEADATAAASSAVAGEAILVLPKGPNDQVATGFELGDGARIADSFWSPVLCATVVRVVGPDTSSTADLIPVVPPTATVVPNHRYHTVATEVRPLPADVAAGPRGPDPYLPLQHGLARTGVLEGRPVLAGAGTRVAVLDSTPEITHRELARVRVAPLPGGPPPAPALHGTLVAGVVAAAENNAFGIAGVAPESDVVVIPVCASSSPSSTVDECRMADLLRGLDQAWKEEARVVNLALVGPPDPVLQRAVDRMRELGVLLVAAAGNEGSDRPRYPAAYPSVIGVGAVDTDGARWPRSNHGPWVAISAPGTEILSTTPGNAFAFGDGSSLAAAHVAGLLAVLLAAADTPEAARLALLEAARGGATPIDAAYLPPVRSETLPMPRLCDAIPLLGRQCPKPARSAAP